MMPRDPAKPDSAAEDVSSDISSRCRWDRILGSRPRNRFRLAVGDSQASAVDQRVAIARQLDVRIPGVAGSCLFGQEGAQIVDVARAAARGSRCDLQLI